MFKNKSIFWPLMIGAVTTTWILLLVSKPFTNDFQGIDEQAADRKEGFSPHAALKETSSNTRRRVTNPQKEDIDSVLPTSRNASTSNESVAGATHAPLFGPDFKLTYFGIRELKLTEEQGVFVQRLYDQFIEEFSSLVREGLRFDERRTDLNQTVDAYMVEPFDAKAESLLQKLNDSLIHAVGEFNASVIMKAVKSNELLPEWGRNRYSIAVSAKELELSFDARQMFIVIDVQSIDPTTNKPVTEVSHVLDTRTGIYATNNMFGKIFEVANYGSEASIEADESLEAGLNGGEAE